MKKLLTLIILVMMVGINTMVLGQANFNTIATGNWTESTTWSITSGSDEDGVPDANDNISIQLTHEVSINQDVAINNISFAGSTSKLSFNTPNVSLSVYGNLIGAANTDDYVKAANGSNALNTSIKFVGSNKQTITLIGGSTNWPNFEVDKSADTLTLSQNTRIDGNLQLTNGVVNVGSKALSMSATSSITINENCSLINVDRVAQTTGGTAKNASITINGYFSTSTGAASINTTTLIIGTGAILELKGSGTGFVNTVGSENPTTMTCSTGSTVKYSYSGSQTGRFTDYYNLVLSGGSTAGSAVKTISAVGTMVINGDFTINNGARLLSGGNINVKGKTTINNNGEILWNGSTGSTFIFDGDVDIYGSSANGVIRFGGTYDKKPIYTFNGNLFVSASATTGALNLNSGTSGSNNRTFEGKFVFNGNIFIESTSSTLTSVSTTDPPSTILSFSGDDKYIQIQGGTSYINMRGNIVFNSNFELKSTATTYYTFTVRPSSVTPQWTATISNGKTLKFSTNITSSKDIIVESNGSIVTEKTLTSNGTCTINGTFQIGQGGWATGSNFTYGENGVLEFANTTGSYGVNNTDVFWPTTNGPKNVNVSGSAGITLNAARTIDGLLQTAATIVNANNLTINGTLQINPNGWLNSSPTYGSNSTLTYKAGYNLSNEWISGSEVGVGIPKNVIIDSETGIVGIPDGSGLRTIKGNLTITSGTFKLGNSIGDDLTIQGNFTNNGSFNPNNRLVTFNGSSLQQITGQTDFDYFTLNNSTDLQINSNTTINQNLNLLQGRIITGENTLVIANNAGVSKTDGYVIGNLRKYFTNSNKSRNFEIGTDNGYSPLNITFNNITVDGYLSVNSKQVVHPSVVNSNESLNRYWSITNNNLEFDSYSMVLSYLSTDFNNVQFVEATDEPTIVVGKFNAGEWTFPTISNRNTTDNTIEISSVTSFSDFTIGKNAAALPVELSNFVASFKNNLVTLTWQTATEINSYCFDVERSNDNTTWIKIGSLNAGGYSNKVLNYEYFDKITTDGKYYYRLKQIDLDGSFKYTSIVEVNAVMPMQYSLSQNYPNPFNPTTKINYSIPVNAKVTLNIYSITGELVSTLVDEDLTAGNYTIDFDASRLASGTYFYRIVANDFVQTKKMILIK